MFCPLSIRILRTVCHKSVSRVVPALALICGLSQVGLGQILDFRLEHVDNSSGGQELERFVTNDLIIDFAGQYTGSQILLQLEQGTVYEHEFGEASPPTSDAIEAIPALAFDTFFMLGVPFLDGPHGDPVLGGGAVNLGGDRVASIGSGHINFNWSAVPGNRIFDQTDFRSARITLSDDAVGSWRLLASADGQISFIGPPELQTGLHFADSGVIRGGAFMFSEQVPEPHAAYLLFVSLSLLGASLLRVRR